MRSIGLALLALVLVPVTADGKKPDAPVRVRWNSRPHHIREGGTWDARLSLLQGPGGFDPGTDRPVIVVTDSTAGAERRVPMRVDVPPNTFRATVPFPHPGLVHVAVTGFDPRDPARAAEIRAPVRIEPAPPPPVTGVGGAGWPSIAVVGVAALAAAWSFRRLRVRAPG